LLLPLSGLVGAVLAREDYVSQSVPFHCTGSRQGLGLALGLLPVKHLSVQVTELHLVIVQQAQAPCRDAETKQSGRKSSGEMLIPLKWNKVCLSANLNGTFFNFFISYIFL